MKQKMIICYDCNKFIISQRIISFKEYNYCTQCGSEYLNKGYFEYISDEED